MIKFAIGVIAGAAAMFVGAWVWIVRAMHGRNQPTPVNETEEE